MIDILVQFAFAVIGGAAAGLVVCLVLCLLTVMFR